MALLQIIYTSHAKVALDEHQLQQLVSNAIASNRQHEITGVLYYADGTYLQVLEGIERDLIPLYASILADARHGDIRTVAIRPIERRDFAEWNMGLVANGPGPADLVNLLNRLDDRIAVWNDASWPSVLGALKARLEPISS